MIAIVDYGMGNVLSVKNSLEYLGENAEICDSVDEISKADKVILPGVGAFPDCIKALKEKNLINILNKKALVDKIPFLGICLGMQVMASYGEEAGGCSGLGWFDAKVLKIKPSSLVTKIPNVGWETISIKQENPLLDLSKSNLDFYFVHSYSMICNCPDDVVSEYKMGRK